MVVDEAHCVVSWALQSGDDEPFRRAFASLRTILSVVPNAKVLALTATAANATREKVINHKHQDLLTGDNHLLMGTSYQLEMVLDSPDRETTFTKHWRAQCQRLL